MSTRIREENVAVLAAAFCLSAFVGSAQAGAPTVQTRDGRVEGFVSSNVTQFLGIPYAEPPIGSLRWRPPKPHGAWNGTLKAKSYGSTCAQIVTLGVFAGPANNNEDCLFLNVFSPNLDASAHLPVLFWIHGGGNVDGESNDYDGSKLAADGKTVVVTINYRLNLMGYFAHPAIDREGHLFGNYGTLDQQLALRWVRQNIQAFGGDPGNITVGGQSAGGWNTEIMLVSPLSQGLFQRAIIQSGGNVFSSNTPLSKAETNGQGFAQAAGCGSGADEQTARCLRNLTAAQVEALAGTASGNSAYITPFVEDGQIVTGSISKAFRNGDFARVPLINGTVQDEGNFGLGITEYFKNPHTPPTADDFKNFVTATYSGNSGPGNSPPLYPKGTVDRVLAQYPVSNYSTPQLALDAVMTDVSACKSLKASQLLSRYVPVYGYEFRDRTAPYYFPKLPGFQSLAYHTADIQYLFPNYHGGPKGVAHPLSAKQEVLSNELVSAWTNLAWRGNPNGVGGTPWPRFNDPAHLYLVENIPALSTVSETDLLSQHKCDFWFATLVFN